MRFSSPAFHVQPSNPYPADGAFAHYRDVTLPAIERREEWQMLCELLLVQSSGNLAEYTSR
jgi:hypothetical protein